MALVVARRADVSLSKGRTMHTLALQADPEK